ASSRPQVPPLVCLGSWLHHGVCADHPRRQDRGVGAAVRGDGPDVPSEITAGRLFRVDNRFTVGRPSRLVPRGPPNPNFVSTVRPLPSGRIVISSDSTSAPQSTRSGWVL